MRFIFVIEAKSPRVTPQDLEDLAYLETQELARYAATCGFYPAICVPKDKVPQDPQGILVPIPLQEGIDVQGAGAYHTEDQKGVISGVVDVSAAKDHSGDIFTASTPAHDSVLKLLDHECKETQADPFVCIWTVDEVRGLAIALEPADGAQGDGLVYTNVDLPANGRKSDVLFANYCTPRWGDSQAPTDGSVMFDMLGIIKHPLTCALTGYETIRNIAPMVENHWGPSHASRRAAQVQALIESGGEGVDATAAFVHYAEGCDERHRQKHLTSPRVMRRIGSYPMRKES